MVWARLDDKFHGNEKALAVGLAATGLWTRCLSYAADKLTDGRVPASVIRLHAGSKSAALVRELVDAGLFEQHEDESLWLHDYLDFNPSREEVERDRDGSARRQAKFRESRRESRRSNAVSNTVTPPVTNGPVTDAPVTRNPYPVPDEKGTQSAGAREGQAETADAVALFAGYAQPLEIRSGSPEWMRRQRDDLPALRDAVAGGMTPDKLGRMAAYVASSWRADGIKATPTVGRVLEREAEFDRWEADGRPAITSKARAPANGRRSEGAPADDAYWTELRQQLGDQTGSPKRAERRGA